MRTIYVEKCKKRNTYAYVHKDTRECVQTHICTHMYKHTYMHAHICMRTYAISSSTVCALHIDVREFVTYVCVDMHVWVWERKYVGYVGVEYMCVWERERERERETYVCVDMHECVCGEEREREREREYIGYVGMEYVCVYMCVGVCKYVYACV